MNHKIIGISHIPYYKNWNLKKSFVTDFTLSLNVVAENHQHLEIIACDVVCWNYVFCSLYCILPWIYAFISSILDSGKPGHPAFQDPRFHSEFPEHPNWQASTADDDDESEGGNSRRKILKWECDEELGSNATISAILYCNMNHPELRTQYPEWSERVKRIAKLWRSLSSDEKQPYLVIFWNNSSTCFIWM